MFIKYDYSGFSVCKKSLLRFPEVALSIFFERVQYAIHSHDADICVYQLNKSARNSSMLVNDLAFGACNNCSVSAMLSMMNNRLKQTEEAEHIIQDGTKTFFDPLIIDVFNDVKEKFKKTAMQFMD